PAAEAQYAAAYARIGFGARGLALGNGLVADVFSAGTSPYYNPALAPRLDGQYLDVAAAFLSHDRSLQQAQFAFPLPPRAGASFGIVRAGVDDIDGRDSSGRQTGALSTEEYVVFTAFGVRLSQRVSAGLGLRFYHADLFQDVDPVVSIALSFGLAAQVSDRLAFGLAVDDLLGRYTWDTSDAFGDDGGQTTDRLPIRVRFGGAYELFDGRGLIAAEVEQRVARVERRTGRVTTVGGVPQVVTETEDLRLAETLFHLGAEVWLAQPFGVRIGVDRLGEEAAPAAGFAVRRQLGDLGGRIDYTARLEPYGAGVAHFVGIHLDL
ncbi:MAG: hypothetical protein R3362_00680, partial [Rhodothermales bacterium]|nr:hypothetical protein [Rhodothermales bacterium]